MLQLVCVMGEFILQRAANERKYLASVKVYAASM
jgi:hypothetical protein